MKKFAIAMVIIILVGVVITGIGCAVFFTSGFDAIDVEYKEAQLFETDEEISSLNLKLRNAHKIVLERGEKCTVKYIDTSVTSFSISAANGKLNISESDWSWKNWLKRIFYRFKSTEVVITVPENTVLDITGDLAGATDATLPAWQYGNINLEVSGAAKIDATDITADAISLDVSGSTYLSISSGTVNSLKMRASGSVEMNCNGLECPSVDIRSSGSSKITLSGTGRELTLNASGSSKIWAKDFQLERADIDASGSVNAELKVSERLKVKTSGSSHIAYWGNPEVVRSTSGSSTIEQRG